MKRSLDLLSALSLLTGVGLLGACGYVYWREQQPAVDAFVVDAPLCSLPAATAMTLDKAEFTVRNVSAHSIKIVGVEKSCGQHNCCMIGQLKDHLQIPPGGTASVQFEVRVGLPGPFSHEVSIYIDDGKWLREAKVGVKGVAVAKPGSTPSAPASKPADRVAVPPL